MNYYQVNLKKKLYSISHTRERIVQYYLVKYQWCLYPAFIICAICLFNFFKSSVVLIERYADMNNDACTFFGKLPTEDDIVLIKWTHVNTASTEDCLQLKRHKVKKTAFDKNKMFALKGDCLCFTTENQFLGSGKRKGNFNPFEGTLT